MTLQKRDQLVPAIELLAGILPRSRGGHFPVESFGQLRIAGLMTAPVSCALGGAGLGLTAGTTDHLLRILGIIGRADLSLGRIYEGHVNALQLVHVFGSSNQRVSSAGDTREGKIFGVWNTDAPECPVIIRSIGPGRWRLAGSKIFCSGAGQVARPIVTARNREGVAQMCIIPAAEVPLRIDLSGWRPLGMEASISGRVAFDEVEIDDDALLGQPGDYSRDPWFRGGAIRFCAVQLGGAEALLKIATQHLRTTGRAEDIMQIARIGRCAIAVEGGRAWLAQSARIFDKAFEGNGEQHTSEIVLHAGMARLAIERICLDAMELTTRSVGVTGLLRPHSLELILRDLATYLRQPAPDAALLSVGRAFLASVGDAD